MIDLFLLVVRWWFAFFIISVIFYPVLENFFSRFFDKGYIFIKVIGLICVSYIAFLLGTLHLFPFTASTLFGVGALLLIFSLIYQVKKGGKNILLHNWRIIVFEEIVFFAGIFFWSYIKSFQPDIHGLEKFMDYGFLNSILRTTYFPAKDMWMTPLSINYYYFGHIMTAVMTKLSFLPSNITFNLMLATLFSFTFTESFSLGANLLYLVRDWGKNRLPFIIAGGLLTGLLLTFGGNLHTLYTFFTPYQNDTPVPPTSLTFSPLAFPNAYWYPNATRFIYHTIHEFPIYSFVVSDLHGHVLDIPAVLLMIALLLLLTINEFRTVKDFLVAASFLGGLTGIMYMTNAWDGIIYLGVTSVLLFVKAFSQKFISTFFSQKFLFSFVTLLACFVIVSLPFSIFFKPFASQIGLNCAPDFLIAIGNIGPLIFERGYCQYSPLWQLIILYGFFIFWFCSFLVFLFLQGKKNKKILPVDAFILGLGLLGFSLIIIPEFFYLKDIYTTYFRANTMFKLVYQSFILLMIVSGYTIIRVFSHMREQKKNIIKRIMLFAYTCLTTVILTLVFLYPYFAIMSYFNNLKGFKGLNGTVYLKSISNDDYQAIQWINQHISNQPVMLEAQGDSYTDYERISSNTGVPTVFGWMVHEWLWRGTYSIVPGRIADVQTLYVSNNIAQTKELLQRYHVAYVYIGDMERTKYPGINEKKFNILGKVVYSSGSVKIYETL